MFLISKIVRGRRLLHELEQQEKEKERERQQQIHHQKETQQHYAKHESLAGPSEAAAPSMSNNDTNAAARRRRFSNLQSKTLAEATPFSAYDSAFYDFAPSTSSIDGNSKSDGTLANPAIQRRKKPVRQKTDSCVPSNNDEQAEDMLLQPPYVDEADNECTHVRRTSSMPSVILDESEKVSTLSMRHYNYDLKLSKLQKKALRFTWHRLHTRNGGRRVENVFEEVFERLTKIVPIMRDMFTTRIFLSAMSKGENSTSTTLREHARLIVRVIDAAVKNLDVDNRRRTDTESEMDPLRVGRAHGTLRPYGFVASLWEKLGETIIDVVLAQEAVRDLPGAGQAWVILTACLVDQLRAGFENSREPTIPPQQLRQNTGTGCPITVPYQYRFQQQKQRQQQEEQQKQQILQEQMEQQRQQQQLEIEDAMQHETLAEDRKEIDAIMNVERLRQISFSDDTSSSENKQLNFDHQNKLNEQNMQRLYDFNRRDSKQIAYKEYSSAPLANNYQNYLPHQSDIENYFMQNQNQLKMSNSSSISTSTSISSGCSAAVQRTYASLSLAVNSPQTMHYFTAAIKQQENLMPDPREHRRSICAIVDDNLRNVPAPQNHLQTFQKIHKLQEGNVDLRPCSYSNTAILSEQMNENQNHQIFTQLLRDESVCQLMRVPNTSPASMDSLGSANSNIASRLSLNLSDKIVNETGSPKLSETGSAQKFLMVNETLPMQDSPSNTSLNSAASRRNSSAEALTLSRNGSRKSSAYFF